MISRAATKSTRRRKHRKASSERDARLPAPTKSYCGQAPDITKSGVRLAAGSPAAGHAATRARCLVLCARTGSWGQSDGDPPIGLRPCRTYRRGSPSKESWQGGSKHGAGTVSPSD